jgi:hypothetical protein
MYLGNAHSERKIQARTLFWAKTSENTKKNQVVPVRIIFYLFVGIRFHRSGSGKAPLSGLWKFGDGGLA